MNFYQITLFNNLSALVDFNKSFVSKDITMDGTLYRIFNYRIASYNDFLEPSALNCRGTMFEMNIDGTPIRLASLPPEKFFNLYENPYTIGLDLSQISNITNKLDGSMISTFMHNGKLCFKTKNSLDSIQAQEALEWLNRYENTCLLDEIIKLEGLGNTIIMEWCSPDNQIVLKYDTASLTILAIRNRIDGNYLDHHNLYFSQIGKYWVEEYTPTNPEQFVKNIKQANDIEGIVILLNSGQRVKVKCKWYINLHQIISSVESHKALFIAALNQRTDDIKSLFHTNNDLISRIESMETHVQSVYNTVIDTVEQFYAMHKSLSRKDYAILLQKTLPKEHFGLAMNLYLEKVNCYISFFTKHYANYLPAAKGF